MTENQTPDASQQKVIRLRFCRYDPASWLAHLDLMRTFERSIRRAGIPVAYSKGFNPRPQLSFALPIGTGLNTMDDYFDMTLERDMPKAELVEKINRSLPEGLSILAARPVEKGGKSLMSQIRAAEYRLDGEHLADAARQLAALPADIPWVVRKNSKKRMVETDIRPLLLSCDIQDDNTLVIRVKAGSRENLRPDLYIQALVNQGGLNEMAAADTVMTRISLLIEDPDQPERLISPIPLDHED